MKIFGIIAKIVIALAAIAGIAYVVVNYGDKIVAWFKKTFGDFFCCDCCCEDCECECDCDECDCDGDCETCQCGEETVVEEVITPEEGAVVAADGDFETE